MVLRPGGNRDDYTFNENYTNQLESNGVWDYAYDDEGNMTGKKEIGASLGWSYGYDHASRPTRP